MDDEIRERIKHAAAILRQHGAKAVYIFGSGASETLREDSDIDLAVEGLPPDEFFFALGKAREAIGRQIDLIDLDESNLFNDYLLRKGKLRRVA